MKKYQIDELVKRTGAKKIVVHHDEIESKWGYSPESDEDGYEMTLKLSVRIPESVLKEDKINFKEFIGGLMAEAAQEEINKAFDL